MQISEARKKAILDITVKKLEKSMTTNGIATSGIEPWRAINFLLDRFNKGNYYGTISIKVTGTSMHNPKEQEVTHKIELFYEEELKKEVESNG